MSVRPGAPYDDQVQDNGKTLIYEGHDNPVPPNGKRPKEVDQEAKYADGKPTQNGLFYEAAMAHRQGRSRPELVRVYEKIKTGIWVYDGHYELVDAWKQPSDGRQVFKFKLRLLDDPESSGAGSGDLDHTRMIPSQIKLDVWKRDGGKCVICGSNDNLHFDHIIPYSRGGTSLDSKNIQILCARHNLQKRDKIE